MEFKEVVGTRRSIRFFKPWQPVERQKIQKILEASNRSSRSMNADYAKPIVVRRQDLPEETLEALRNPTTTADLDLAPVYIFWYLDTNYPQGGADRLKELVENHVLTPSHGWSKAYVDEFLWPQVLKPIADNQMAVMFMGTIEVGQAIANALLAAVDEGLGSCLHAFTAPDKVKDLFHVPDSWIPIWLQLLGYPAEEMAAGGQRPRRPLSNNYFEGSADTPWEEDLEVTESLKKDKLIQDPGPFPHREMEVKMLSRMFGLPE
jgi:nitroreductase